MKRLSMVTTILIVFVILASSGKASGELAILGNDICVSGPRTPWELCFPKQAWKPTDTRNTEGGIYYALWNDTLKLNASFFIEKATKCSSADSCRDFTWGHVKETVRNAREERRTDINGFSVMVYTVLQPAMGNATQYHYAAHLVRDGFWVDMHLSKFPGSSGDDGLFSGFVNSISVRTRVRGT